MDSFLRNTPQAHDTDHTMGGGPPFAAVLLCFGMPVPEHALGFLYLPEADSRATTEKAIHIAAQETTGAEPEDKEPDQDRPDPVDT